MYEPFYNRYHESEHNKLADRMKNMANTAKELSTVSISFCSLKYEDLKNEDSSLTYPNLIKKRKQIDVVSSLPHITPHINAEKSSR